MCRIPTTYWFAMCIFGFFFFFFFFFQSVHFHRLWRNTQTSTNTYAHTNTHTRVHICNYSVHTVHTYTCMCVRVCECEHIIMSPTPCPVIRVPSHSPISRAANHNHLCNLLAFTFHPCCIVLSRPRPPPSACLPFGPTCVTTLCVCKLLAAETQTWHAGAAQANGKVRKGRVVE